MAQDKPFQIKDIPLAGKLITAISSAFVGENFTILKNLRYTDTNPETIGGHTKINTTALSTYLKVRNGFHLRKPDESHIFVQAYNSGETASQILQNTTAIPSQGDFSGTALHTDGSGAGTGRFASTPLGEVAYCNGVESLIWPGDEQRVSGFVNYDPNGDFSYDFSDEVSNSLTTEYATVTNADGGLDANTMLLLHLDNNVTDSSPTTAHTVTNNNVTFSSSVKVFGTHSAVFNGTNASLTVPDDADFDFSGGVFTVDGRFRVDSLASANPIYYQETDANNYISMYISTAGAVVLSIYDTGSEVVALSTATGLISIDTQYHIAIIENGNNFYIFIDGILKASTSDTDRAANYTSTAYIGTDTSVYFDGYIDEYRVSDAARWTTDFEPPLEAYSASPTAGYFYIGSIRPLKGIKFYIGTANTASGTMVVQYWNGSAWESVSTLSDGTASGGVPFAQTGTATFDDTDSSAKLRYLNQTYIYWYRVYIDAVDDTTTIYNVTLSAEIQSIKDIWDGQERTCFSFQVYDNSTYNDNTINVNTEDYSSANTASYADLSSLTSSTDYIVAGFTEKMAGLIVTMVGGNVNTTAATNVTVSYWNGSGWTSVGNVDDGTSENGISFAKSGVITWNKPDTEFKTSISKEFQLYYYKVEWDQNTSGTTYLDKLAGIPAQKDIRGYKFPLHAQDRLWLCSDQTKDKNSITVSAYSTSVVFNGNDSATFWFGDDTEVIAGTSIYSQFGSSLYDIIVICKENETWIITGTGPESWQKFRVSGRIGCAAPLTITQAHIDVDIFPGFNRNVAIWQSNDGIYLFDGRTFLPLHKDIDDVFDKRNSSGLNRDMVSKSIGFFDNQNQEYHWLWASGTSTTLDKEYVYDLQRQKWYVAERPTALQFGMEVLDTNSNQYNYGFIDTGYMYRLENGNTFDGSDITSTLQTGDIFLGGSPMIESTVRCIKLTMAAKTTTSNTVTLSHYGDASETATLSNTYAPQKSGYTIAMPKHDEKLGAFTTHKFKLTMTTDDETVGFEPLILSLQHKNIRLS